jgi:uncharacterized repeat protein (TIGR03837 family)
VKTPSHKPPTWDLFCRVVDNYGDAGVCWRLARDLAARGQQVRLVIDDAAPLAFMAPLGAPGVQVLPWPGPAAPGNVVVEAFGCDPPEAFVAAMAACRLPPVWINLEYLSAEPFVERSHGLPSPQRNGMTKHFFYPGFTARTGGLLREASLQVERKAFDRHAWLAEQGLHAQPGERIVTLFCYDNAALPALLADLAREPTLLLVTPGHAQRQVAQMAQVAQVTQMAQMAQMAQAPGPVQGNVRRHQLPYLTQRNFDRLLWAADLNFVRGEDSLVRALWAGAPFVWQAYPQHDGAHRPKVESLLDQWQASASVAALWRVWNALPGAPWTGLPPLSAWEPGLSAWHQRLWAQDDLATQLLGFVAGKTQI